MLAIRGSDDKKHRFSDQNFEAPVSPKIEAGNFHFIIGKVSSPSQHKNNAGIILVNKLLLTLISAACEH